MFARQKLQALPPPLPPPCSSATHELHRSLTLPGNCSNFLAMLASLRCLLQCKCCRGHGVQNKRAEGRAG